MAEIRSIYTDRRTDNRTEADRRRDLYVDGSAVRKFRVKEQPKQWQIREEQSSVHRAHRIRTRQMGIGHVLFLAAALGVAMWVCVGYLQLQADNTARVKNLAALESELSQLKDENDDEYNRVTTSVVLYDNEGSDYVKQYADIPESNEGGLKGVLGTISR